MSFEKGHVFLPKDTSHVGEDGLTVSHVVLLKHFELFLRAPITLRILSRSARSVLGCRMGRSRTICEDVFFAFAPCFLDS